MGEIRIIGEEEFYINGDAMDEKSTPFFSILIPVYNQKEYLPQCLDSVLNQTLSDYEVIVVNDGSTDGSSEVCDEYQSIKPARIQVIHQKNSGVLAARMRALSAAKGKYILFLDSDDAYRCDTLEVLKQTVEKNHADVVVFQASVSEDFKAPYGKAPFKDSQVFRNKEKSEVYSVLCSTHLLNSLCLKAIKKSLFCSDQGSNQDYNSELGFIGYGEDLYLSIPVLDRAETVVFINENLYFYRQNPKSATHTYSARQFDSIKRVCERLQWYAAIWEKEYGIAYPGLTDHYCAIECYSTIKNIGSSNLNVKEKRNEIEKLKKDPFFRRFLRELVSSNELSTVQKLLFVALYCNVGIVLKLLSLGFSIIKRNA